MFHDAAEAPQHGDGHPAALETQTLSVQAEKNILDRIQKFEGREAGEFKTWFFLTKLVSNSLDSEVGQLKNTANFHEVEITIPNDLRYKRLSALI